MDSKTIREYLSVPRDKRDFAQGLQIYENFRGNPNLKRLFNLKGATTYNVEKLEYELQAILSRIPSDGAAKETQTPKSPKSKPKEEEPATDLPSALAKLQEERKVLLQEAAHLHSRLDIEQDEEKRRESCEIIVFNSLRINQIHRILEHASETGELLKVEAIRKPDPKRGKDYPSMTEAQLIKERNNLRSSISKNKNNPARLEEIQSRLELVEKLLTKFKS